MYILNKEEQNIVLMDAIEDKNFSVLDDYKLVLFKRLDSNKLSVDSIPLPDYIQRYGGNHKDIPSVFIEYVLYLDLDNISDIKQTITALDKLQNHSIRRLLRTVCVSSEMLLREKCYADYSINGKNIIFSIGTISDKDKVKHSHLYMELPVKSFVQIGGLTWDSLFRFVDYTNFYNKYVMFGECFYLQKDKWCFLRRENTEPVLIIIPDDSNELSMKTKCKVEEYVRTYRNLNSPETTFGYIHWYVNIALDILRLIVDKELDDYGHHNPIHLDSSITLPISSIGNILRCDEPYLKVDDIASKTSDFIKGFYYGLKGAVLGNDKS